jgi:hypothetical protein
MCSAQKFKPTVGTDTRFGCATFYSPGITHRCDGTISRIVLCQTPGTCTGSHLSRRYLRTSMPPCLRSCLQNSPPSSTRSSIFARHYKRCHEEGSGLSHIPLDGGICTLRRAAFCSDCVLVSPRFAHALPVAQVSDQTLVSPPVLSSVGQTEQTQRTATMADRYIPEHRRTQFKAKNAFKPEELRRRREEQQVEIRKTKREENLAKRRGIGGSEGRLGASLGAAPDSDDDTAPTESQVCRYFFYGLKQHSVPRLNCLLPPSSRHGLFLQAGVGSSAAGCKGLCRQDRPESGASPTKQPRPGRLGRTSTSTALSTFTQLSVFRSDLSSFSSGLGPACRPLNFPPHHALINALAHTLLT